MAIYVYRNTIYLIDIFNVIHISLLKITFVHVHTLQTTRESHSLLGILLQ